MAGTAQDGGQEPEQVTRQESEVQRRTTGSLPGRDWLEGAKY